MHTLGLPTLGRRAAYAATERDPHTGDLPLKWSQHQLLLTIEVKACPVQVFKLALKKRRELRSVGDKVALIRQQGFQLRGQQTITVQTGPGSV
jgi:hypothetical protein